MLTCRTRFAKRRKACLDTQFKRLYDLGLIDFVSARWQCQDMVLIWRSPLSLEALKFYLPVFIAGAATPKVRLVHAYCFFNDCPLSRVSPSKAGPRTPLHQPRPNRVCEAAWPRVPCSGVLGNAQPGDYAQAHACTSRKGFVRRLLVHRSHTTSSRCEELWTWFEPWEQLQRTSRRRWR